MPREKREERQEGKRVRVPFSARRSKLQLSDEDRKALERKGYKCRWINDIDGRLQRALAGGYEYVVPSEAMSVGHGALGETNSDLGDRVKKVVSRGDPVIYAFLMKIKKEFYEEDQREKEALNAKVDEALSSGSVGGADVENSYGPGGRYTH